MKAFQIIAKIVVALAAVAGAVYLAATYGDRIVAWAKNLLKSCPCCCDCDCDECDCEGDCDACECETACDCGCSCEAEAPVEEAAEEAPVEDIAVAEQADFEG